MQILELCAERRTPNGEGTPDRQPPRLLARTLTVTFATVVLIQAAVFLVLTYDLQRRARNEVVDDLDRGEPPFRWSTRIGPMRC